MTNRAALQVARVPLLLALLHVTGLYGFNATRLPESVTALWVSWATLSLVSVLFVAVMLVGRRHWHSWTVLAIEAVVAATFAFVPAAQWALWIGLNQWTLALLNGTLPSLAVAWLGVVVARGVYQLRDGRK